MAEKVEPVYPYQRKKGSKTSKPPGYKKKDSFMHRQQGRFFLLLVKKLRLHHVMLAAAGVFLGRAVLLGELCPFGAAFVAGVFWHLRLSGIFAAAGVLGGLYSIVPGGLPGPQVFSVLLAGLAVYFIPVHLKRPWLAVPGTVFAVVLVTRVAFLAFSGAIPYDYISLVFEAVFAALLTPAVMYALPALSMMRSPGVLKGEELFCITVLLGGMVAGTSGLDWYLFSLDSMLSYFFILVAALTGGNGLGAAAGAVLGVIPGLAYTVSPEIIGAYSFSGLLAGLFRLLGKPGAVLGFLLGNILVAVYLSDYNGLAPVIAQTGVAALVFLSIPWKWLNELKSFLSFAAGDGVPPGSENRARELVEERAHRWSGVIKEIAVSFEQAAATGCPENSDKDLDPLFGEISKKVCSGCSHYSVCWEREFYKTYRSFLNMLSIADTYGRVTVDDLDDDMIHRCSRTRELVMAVTCLYELFKVNNFWSKRLQESKGLVSEQLRGISDVIENIPGQLDSSEDFYRREARAIKEKLKKSGLRVYSLDIYSTGGEYPEVSITMPSCGGRMLCRYEVGPFVSRELECSMSVAAVCCSQAEEKEFCTYRVYPQPAYQVSLGAAGAVKKGNNVSGDSYRFVSLSGGKFAVMLSDGMGSGHNAAVESSATLNLMTRLLDAGFNRDLAVKTINSILLLRSPRESFATLDMAIIDLYNAEGEFIKVGAPPGFVVRGRRVGTVSSSSLPVGIVKDVEVFTITRQMSDGDLVIMVTDGILDAYNGQGEKKDWLAEVLQEVPGLKPQEVAELIVNLAQAKSVGDDMTALVIKLEKVKD